MRRLSISATVLMISALLSSNVANASPSIVDLSIDNMGSAEWWASVPHQFPKRSRKGNVITLTCPKGYWRTVAGIPVTIITESGGTSDIKVDRKKFVNLTWKDGKKKRVRQGTSVCLLGIPPLQPQSPQQLSTWTFTPLSQLARPVWISQPPLDTCVPNVLPTSWTPTVISNDLVSSGNPIQVEENDSITTTTSDGPPGLGGIWTVRWRLVGGSGVVRYETLEKSPDGVYRWQEKQIPLDPEGTDIDVTLMMSRGFFGISTPAGGFRVSYVDANCGQQYLPPWQDRGWYSRKTSSSTPFAVQFSVLGSPSDPIIEKEENAPNLPLPSFRR